MRQPLKARKLSYEVDVKLESEIKVLYIVCSMITQFVAETD